MSCICWYNPPEESKKYIKDRCIEIVNEVKRLNNIGDPIDYKLSDIHKLLDHLYYPENCDKK